MAERTESSIRKRVATVGVVLCVAAIVGVTVALAQRGVNDPGDQRFGGNTPEHGTQAWERPIELPPERPIRDAIVPTRQLNPQMTAADLGCIDDLSADALDGFLSERLGPSLGLDDPSVIELGDDRYLWLFNDAFMDYTGDAEVMDVQGEVVYVPNVGILQEGLCFQMVHRGTLARPGSFQLLPQADQREGRFLWPLDGGMGADGRLYVFWSEMEEDDHPGRPHGIKRHPEGTWLATYDATTLRELDIRPAPNPGVMPQYGTAVATDGDYSYLFGNSNQLNLDLEGGFWAEGPFTASQMFLARVPAGRFLEEPEYHTGDGWSDDPDDAVAFSDRYRLANVMRPRVIDGTWYSVTAADEFWEERIVVERANRPVGPWETVFDEEVDPIPPDGIDPDIMNNYHPTLAPWLDPSGDLIVVLSQNGRDFGDAILDPRLYRPRAFTIEVPDN